VFGLPDAAVGAVIAALVTGIISLLGLIISKEQKTSDFRQAWIDGLRSEISLLIAHVNIIHTAKARGADDWRELRADAIAINHAVAQIKLRLNPNEAASRKILNRIDVMETLLHANETPFEDLNHMEEGLAGDAQALLKAEWVRVRNGEIAFRFAKFASATIIIVLIILLLISAVIQR
jgi:hypothetical protein